MGSTILIFGAGGRLGRQLSALPDAVGMDRAMLDITDAAAVAAALRATQPRVVINAAAFADVDGCERDPDRAHRANVLAPTVLAQECARADVGLIHISTDYVFGADGHDRPRRETDPPAPINAYGRSKLAGEAGVLAAGGASLIVRVAWLFGFAGDFLDRMLTKGRQTGALAITTQAGTPTPVDGLSLHLHALADRLSAGEALGPVLHLAGQPVTDRASWVAAALAAAPGHGIRLDPVGLDAFADAAARPLGTPLDCTRYQSLTGRTLNWRPAAFARGQSLLG